VWDAAAGRTSFIALQRRMAAGRGVADLVDAWPAHMVCFDLLQARGTVLLDEPLARRRTMLEAVLTDAPAALQLCPQTTDRDVVRDWIADLPVTGVEGIVIKGADTRYRPGQPDWHKFRIYTTTVAIIAGLTGSAAQPTGLLLARFDQSGRLRYVARSHALGTAAQRAVVAASPRPATNHPWPQPLPATWSGSFGPRQATAYIAVEPEAVAEIEVDSTVEYGRWRHNVRFVRIRVDLTTADVPLAA
jgi:ATP-dependent DNA ligase